MNRRQLPYLLAFNSLPRLSPRRLLLLLRTYGYDAEAAWRDGPHWPGLAERLGAASRQEVEAAYRQLEPVALCQRFDEYGCSLTAWGDDDYPPLLAEIYDPPLLLMYWGRLPRAEELCLAMVGSRKYSGYGRQVAEILSRDLALAGVTIVSGMARGIDSFCHRGALRGGGRTLAVLGSGLDVIYPRENSGLYREICAHGAVLSEFPLGAAPEAHHFPRRNRIISGLCSGLLVVEAGRKSGTMLTVDYALEQGRDVFAVPGPITSPTSEGCNILLRDGCNLTVLSAEDVLRQYRDQPQGENLFSLPRPTLTADTDDDLAKLSAIERSLLDALTLPVQIDDIAQLAQVELSPGDLAALLTMLEIRGLLRQLPGNYYQRIAHRIG